MTIQEVIDKILQYHPAIMRYTGCDEFKCGDPSAECTGIVTAMDATVNVVKKAAELGANLIIVHEPTNYTSSDRPGWYEDFKNDVFAEKWKILSDNGIVCSGINNEGLVDIINSLDTYIRAYSDRYVPNGGQLDLFHN